MDKLTAEEIRVLRREAHGKGGLVAAGFITITRAGKDFITQDDERILSERVQGGKAGGKFGKEGGPKMWKKKKGGKK